MARAGGKPNFGSLRQTVRECKDLVEGTGTCRKGTVEGEAVGCAEDAPWQTGGIGWPGRSAATNTTGSVRIPASLRMQSAGREPITSCMEEACRG